MKWFNLIFRALCIVVGILLLLLSISILQVATFNGANDTEGLFLLTTGFVVLGIGLGFVVVAWRAKLHL